MGQAVLSSIKRLLWCEQALSSQYHHEGETSLLLHTHKVNHVIISAVTLPRRGRGQRVRRPPLPRHPRGGRGLLQLRWSDPSCGEDAGTDETGQTGGG